MSLVPFIQKDARKRWLVGLASGALVCLIVLGVMAENGWLPRTDPVSGKKTGWFGLSLPNNAASTWNPLAAPPTSPTPQLSKEYIYAGSRLLAVEDANANAAPPADLAVWRPGDGTWYILGGPGSDQFAAPWGMSGDIPVPGDYDGDGKTDLSIYRPGDQYYITLRSSDNTYYFTTYGVSTDMPIAADFDGDGRSDHALWRDSTGVFYFIASSTNTPMYAEWGMSGDKPIAADYTGDGKAEVAVWRNSDTTLYWMDLSTSQWAGISIGQSGSQPVSADYDGDGKADPAVFSGNTWTIRYSSTNTTSNITWQTGNSGSDVPGHNDYDGDGKVDIAFWRPSNGNWYIRQSATSGSLRQEAWGGIINGVADIPVPAYYRR